MGKDHDSCKPIQTLRDQRRYQKGLHMSAPLRATTGSNLTLMCGLISNWWDQRSLSRRLKNVDRSNMIYSGANVRHNF